MFTKMKLHRLFALFTVCLLLAGMIPAYASSYAADTALKWNEVIPTTQSTAHLTHIAYGNSTFVAMGELYMSPDLVTTSKDDGKTWSAQQAISGYKKFTALKFLNGKFYMVAVSDSNQNVLLTSTNGTAWTTAATFSNYSGYFFNDISINGANIVLVGGDSGQSYGIVVSSTDSGATWATRLTTSAGNGPINTINFMGDRFVLAGQHWTLYVSNDATGTSWTTMDAWFLDRGTINMTFYSSSVYADETLVVAGLRFNHGGGIILTSPDKLTNLSVENQKVVGTEDLNGVTYGSGTFVAVGEYCQIAVSKDKGLTWATQQVKSAHPIGDDRLYAVAFGSKAFVATGSNGRILRSDDVGAASSGGSGSTSISASNVTLTNNLAPTADTVKVTGLAVSDVVKVYASNGTSLLGTGTVAAGKTELSLSISQLGMNAGMVKISVTSKGKPESDKLEVSFDMEPQTDAPTGSNVTYTNNLGIPDTVKVTSLVAGDIVKVYKHGDLKTLLGTGTVAAGKTDVTISLKDTGATAGSVDLTVTTKNKRESQVYEAAYEATPQTAKLKAEAVVATNNFAKA
ncbi:hypothetical protein B5M42_023955, partial [Paenibacillus athensensis]|nr:hypothetical protein [Paenibacillus athensensis]